MALRRRLRIIVPGGALVAALGLAVAGMSLASFFADPQLETIIVFCTSVLLGPLFFLLSPVRIWLGFPGAVPAQTLAIAVLAIIAVPFHPLFGSRWAAWVTILGLIAWLLCEIIVAGAPA